ncbi:MULTISPECIES: nicotinate-nucleotide--dimethylbenzimidazole phosphoribosyltransferase [Calditerrivibrio]|uniref:nicotinate-nucleotide--dimethylbenzimidazole phosphoribosyltransferase n=1 Tax=Calditerrivibrio TaxID=545865 RepID=UPI003C76209D
MKLDEILQKIEPIDESFRKKAMERNDNLLMPLRAMGRLHEISEQLAAIYRTLKPKMEKGAVFVMAGDHGVVEEGVSSFPQEVTGLMFNAFLNDLATVSVLGKLEGLDIILADIGSKFDPSNIKNFKNEFVAKKVVSGTRNFTREPAMTKEEAIRSIEAGIEITLKYIKKKKLDVVITGEMGIGNTTPSAAIGAVITGSRVEDMTGKGAGLNIEGVKRKIDVIKRGIEIHKPDPEDPIDILSKVGGAEIGAIAGIILAAAYSKIPAIIDGFISTAGALIAYKLNSATKGYMIAGHCSEEPGHIRMLNYLNIKPILNLNMRLGEGTGAVLALPIVKQAANMISNVATFEEAGIPK